MTNLLNGLSNQSSLSTSPNRSVLKQLLFKSLPPSLNGVIRDESSGLGTYRATQPGRCANFDGVNDYINCGTILNQNSAFTVSAWVKKPTVAAQEPVISNRNGGDRYIGFSSSGKVFIYLTEQDPAGIVGATTIPANEWFHAAWVYTPTSVKLYLNGVLDLSQVVTLTPNSNNSNWYVGYDVGTADYLEGQLFDLRVYAEELSTSQVFQLYTLGIDALPLVATALHYKLDEQHLTRVFDSSGNERHGTINNHTATVGDFFYEGPDVPFSWQNEKGYSLRFNLLSYSEDFSDATWQSLQSGTGVAGVKTPNYGVAPDLTTTACRIQLDVSAASAGNESQIAKIFTTETSANNYSCWIKTTDGSTKTIMGFTAGAATPSTLTITGTWTRHSVVRTPGGTTDYIQFLLVKGTTSDTADLLVWHPQVTIESNLKDYSPTKTFAITENTLLPRDESDKTKDVNGSILDYSGKCGIHGLASSSCLSLDGTDDYIAIASLTGSETVVSSEGISTPTISSGRIDFTAGTCWNLLLSNGSHYPMSESASTKIHDTVGTAHGVLTNANLTTAWGTKQEDFAWNLSKGFTFYQNLYDRGDIFYEGGCTYDPYGSDDPFGGSGAYEIVLDNTGTAEAGLRTGYNVRTAGSKYTISVYAKKTNAGKYLIIRDIGATSAVLYPACVFFNLDTGEIDSIGSFISNAFMIDVGGGWYRCIVFSQTENPMANDLVDLRLSDTLGTLEHVLGDAVAIYAFQINNGFQLSSSVNTTVVPINEGFVPARADGISDANGNPIQYPSGLFHNFCESIIDTTGGVQFPEYTTMIDDWHPLVYDNISGNPNFHRVLKSDSVPHSFDRITEYTESLSSNRLSAAEIFTQEKEIV